MILKKKRRKKKESHLDGVVRETDLEILVDCKLTVNQGPIWQLEPQTTFDWQSHMCLEKEIGAPWACYKEGHV